LQAGTPPAGGVAYDGDSGDGLAAVQGMTPP
jgi:hypothetical protein